MDSLINKEFAKLEFLEAISRLYEQNLHYTHLLPPCCFHYLYQTNCLMLESEDPTDAMNTPSFVVLMACAVVYYVLNYLGVHK